MRKRSAVETWLEEGRQEGHRVASAVLPAALQQRFGPLPQHVPTKIAVMSLPDIESLGQRLASAITLADLNLAE